MTKCNAELHGIQCLIEPPHKDRRHAHVTETMSVFWRDDVPGAKPHEEPEWFVTPPAQGEVAPAWRVRRPDGRRAASFWPDEHPDAEAAAESEARRLNGEPCCDAAAERDALRERMAAIAAEDPESRSLHRPMRLDGRFCRYCGTAWPCRTALAAGIKEVTP